MKIWCHFLRNYCIAFRQKLKSDVVMKLNCVGFITQIGFVIYNIRENTNEKKIYVAHR